MNLQPSQVHRIVGYLEVEKRAGMTFAAEARSLFFLILDPGCPIYETLKPLVANQQSPFEGVLAKLAKEAA